MHLNVHVVGPESTLFFCIKQSYYSICYNITDTVIALFIAVFMQEVNQCVADGGV